jgi:hypothetical protein
VIMMATTTQDDALTKPKLTPDQVAAIPILYARCGNKRQVARDLGISEGSVRRHLEDLPDERWERIQATQLKEIIRGSVEIIMACVAKISDPNEIKNMSVHQAIGAFKIMAGETRSWGLGAIAKPNGGAGDDADSFLAAVEAKRQRDAMEEAIRTGSVEGLKAFVK